MSKFVEVGKDKDIEYNLETFRFERIEEAKIIFKDEIFKSFTFWYDGEFKIDFYQNFEPHFKKEYFYGVSASIFWEYVDNNFTFSYVNQSKVPTTIINIFGSCEKF